MLKLFRFKDSPVLMTDLVLKIALIILPSVSAEHMGCGFHQVLFEEICLNPAASDAVKAALINRQ